MLMEEKKTTPKKWKRILLTILCLILALVLIVLVFTFAFVNRLLNQMNRVDPNKESAIASSALEQLLATDPDLETIQPDSTETLPHISDLTFPTEPPETEPEQGGSEDTGSSVVEGDHYINILLIGQDRRPGQGRQRSDSMILVTVNKSQKTITLTSFMRDQYVQIPGYMPHKLNHTYQYGGMKLLNETLMLNFGVRVDGNVEVDLSGFVQIIDLLGGVEINMTEKEARYIGACFGKDMKAGVNLLSGKEAQYYSQLREIDTDYRRAERQRKVIMAIINKYKSRPLDELLSLTEQILPMVTTDMSNTEILGYALEIFPMLTEMEYGTMRIPVEGTYQQGNVQVRDGVKNWFQYNIDFAANRKVLNEIFAE